MRYLLVFAFAFILNFIILLIIHVGRGTDPTLIMDLLASTITGLSCTAVWYALDLWAARQVKK